MKLTRIISLSAFTIITYLASTTFGIDLSSTLSTSFCGCSRQPPFINSTTSTTTPDPESTSTFVYVSPPAIATTSINVEPTTTFASAPATCSTYNTSSSVSGSGSTSGQYTGDMTHYDPSGGLSSCGWQGYNYQDIVALSIAMMQNGPNPNTNPKCGKTINIYYMGNTHQATVFDTCQACSYGSIDVTEQLFNKVAPGGDGRVSGVSWSFTN